MSIAIPTPVPAASVPAVSVTRPSGKPIDAKPVTYARQVVSEWRKIWSLRSTWILIAAVVVIMGLVAGIAGHYSFGPQMPGPFAANAEVAVLAGGVELAMVVVIAFACLMITGEFSTGMIHSTLTAEPRRGAAFAAKATVGAAIAAIIGILSDVVSYVVSWPFLAPSRRVDLAQWANLRPLLGVVLFLVMWTLFALAVGTLLRNTAAVLASILCWVFVIEKLIASIPWHFFHVITPYLPLQASFLITRSDPGFRTMVSQPGNYYLHNMWQGYGVGLIWAAVLVIAAVLVFRKRDV